MQPRQLLRLAPARRREGLRLAARQQEGGVQQYPLPRLARRRRPPARVVRFGREQLEEGVGAVARVLDDLPRRILLLLLPQEERGSRRPAGDGLRLLLRS